jgi:hypothetical protein
LGLNNILFYVNRPSYYKQNIVIFGAGSRR